MLVMKFGGTSVESAEAIHRVAGIVRERLPRHPVVVVSAMDKTTNKLLAIASTAAGGGREAALGMLSDLHETHVRESAGLGVDAEVAAHFQELTELVKGLAVMGELTPRATDAIASYGERVSSIIVAALFRRCGIRATHLDARRVIVTDGRHTQAAPLFRETNARLEATVPALAREHVDSLVLMDDALGREQAAALGLDALGVAGVLLAAKRAGIVKALRPLLDRLARRGFVLPDAEVQTALANAAE